MIAGGGSTRDYWKLEKESKWLGVRGASQRKRPNYEKVEHNSPWRFYPSKSKGASKVSIFSSSNSAIEEYVERRNRRKRPRTLRPIPPTADVGIRDFGEVVTMRDSTYTNSLGRHFGSESKYNLYGDYAKGGKTGFQSENSDVYGSLLGQQVSKISNRTSPQINGRTVVNRTDQRWIRHQETIDDTLTLQLRYFKTENKKLKRQKKATMYILRLLEQKILQLSGSHVTVEPVDTSNAGYEMHPEVYAILKSDKTQFKIDEPAKGNSVEVCTSVIPLHTSEANVKIPNSLENPFNPSNKNTPCQINEEKTMTSLSRHLTCRNTKNALCTNGVSNFEFENFIKKISFDDPQGLKIFYRALTTKPDIGRHVSIQRFCALRERCKTTLKINAKFVIDTLEGFTTTVCDDEQTKILAQMYKNVFNNANNLPNRRSVYKTIACQPSIGKYLKLPLVLKLKEITGDNFNFSESRFIEMVKNSRIIGDNINAKEGKNNGAHRKHLSTIFKKLDSKCKGVLSMKSIKIYVQTKPEFGAYVCPSKLYSLDSTEPYRQNFTLEEFIKLC